MLDYGPFIVYFTLSYFFCTLRNISLYHWGQFTLLFRLKKESNTGLLKEEPTKIQWGSGNDEAPLCFQAGIQNYTLNDTRREGEKREMNTSQKYWSHGWCFRLQLRDSWTKMILEWMGLCRTFNLTSYFTMTLVLW